MTDAVIRLERLRDPLPGAMAGPLADDQRAGTRFVRRLVDDWTSGVNRFDRPGEALFGAWIGGPVPAATDHTHVMDLASRY